MSGDVFTKMMNWISAFIAKIVELFKGFGDIFTAINLGE